MRRRVGVTVVIGVVASTAIGGYAVGSQISSPADVALRTAPPSPSPILVPVERRRLTSDVVTRGTGAFGSPQKLTLATSALKPGAGILAVVAPAGTQLAEGDVAAAASGRPVFVLTGAQPMSRDLGGGSVGEDVRQLEASLARLGFDPGAVDGHYDDRTGSAVAAWFTSRGFAPFEATPEQLAAVRARTAEQSAAVVESNTAADALANATASLVAARSAQRVAVARAASARRAVMFAAASARAQDRLAEADVALKRGALETLRRSAASPPATVATGTSGDQAPTTTGPTAAEVAAAEQELAVAESSRETTRLAGLRGVDDAEVAVGEADADTETRVAAVTAAETSVRTAAQTAATRSFAAELAAQDAARTALVANVQVPADEIVFVAASSVRVSELLVGVGDPAIGSVMKVTDSTVHVDAALALDDVGLVHPGMTARIEEPDLGVSASGTLVEVAPSPGTNGVDGFHVYARIDVSEPPATLIGASVRVIVPVESTAGEALAVPVSAVTLQADGTSRLQRSRDGTTSFVTVEPQLSAQGFVAVRAVGETLSEGDLVVIGTDNPTPATPPGTTARR